MNKSGQYCSQTNFPRASHSVLHLFARQPVYYNCVGPIKLMDPYILVGWYNLTLIVSQLSVHYYLHVTRLPVVVFWYLHECVHVAGISDTYLSCSIYKPHTLNADDEFQENLCGSWIMIYWVCISTEFSAATTGPLLKINWGCGFIVSVYNALCWSYRSKPLHILVL